MSGEVSIPNHDELRTKRRPLALGSNRFCVKCFGARKKEVDCEEFPTHDWINEGSVPFAWRKGACCESCLAPLDVKFYSARQRPSTVHEGEEVPA